MTYNIRLATLNDLEDLYRMCVDHYHSSAYTFQLSQEKGKGYLRDLLRHENGLVLLMHSEKGSHGCFLAIAQEHPFLPISTATELMWWVDPSHRGRHSLELLKAFEYWAKNIKHVDMVMCADVFNYSIEPIYRRMGYKPEERTFVKVFT